MKIGMNLLLWLTHVEEKHLPLLESLKKEGFDGVEIPLGMGDVAHYKTMKRHLDNLGLQVTNVTSLDANTNAVSPDKAVRQKGVERLKWALDMAAALGSQALVGPYHSAYAQFAGRPVSEDELNWSAEVLREAAEYSATLHIPMAVEALNRFECYVLNTAEQARDLVRRVGHSNLGYLYDTHHAHIEEKNPAAAIKASQREIKHIHISENDRGTPGKGQVAWKDSFAAMKAINYDAWMVIESFSLAVPDFAAAIHVYRNFSPSDEIYQDGLRFIQKMWREAGK